MPAPISTTPVISDACDHAPPDRGARLRRRGVEGDWPCSHRVKRFVRGLESSRHERAVVWRFVLAVIVVAIAFEMLQLLP